MSKKLVTFIICAAVAVAAGNIYLYAREKRSRVPQNVLDAFSKQYPGVQADWEKEMGNYEASFEKGKHEVSVSYDPQGNMLEMEEEIDVSEAPLEIKAYADQHYHKSISEMYRIKTASGIIIYEAELGNVELVFDAQGKFIR